MGFEAKFKALADSTRCGIIEILREGPQCAGDLSKRFGLTGATVSHHLSVLKDADLVLDEKRGKYIYYELNTSVLDDLIIWVTGLGGAGNEKKK